jgi:hypothetical protein
MPWSQGWIVAGVFQEVISFGVLVPGEPAAQTPDLAEQLPQQRQEPFFYKNL